MKVGDMVQYTHHSDWTNGGLGVIVDINGCQQCNIAWLDDIEDYGWNEAIENHAQWYDDADFEEDIKLFAATHASR